MAKPDQWYPQRGDCENQQELHCRYGGQEGESAKMICLNYDWTKHPKQTRTTQFDMSET